MHAAGESPMAVTLPWVQGLLARKVVLCLWWWLACHSQLRQTFQPESWRVNSPCCLLTEKPVSCFGLKCCLQPCHPLQFVFAEDDRYSSQITSFPFANALSLFIMIWKNNAFAMEYNYHPRFFPVFVLSVLRPITTASMAMTSTPGIPSIAMCW